MKQYTVGVLKTVRVHLMAATESIINVQKDPDISEEEYLSLMQLLSKSTLTVNNILRTNDPSYKESMK